MRKVLSFFFIASLLGCSRSSPQQRSTASLEKELEQARIELHCHQDKVVLLQRKLYEQQVQEIAHKVEEVEALVAGLEFDPSALRAYAQRHLPVLFQEERRSLCRLIDEESEVSERAQAVLDQILRLITDLSGDRWDAKP